MEYLANPLAIDAQQPRLTWEFVQQGARGARQTAWRILVASRPDILAAGRGDVWDSAKVASAESVNVTYGGRPLRSRERVHWKVQAWDERDRPGPWSAPAEWTMGLLDPGDWSARWIRDTRAFDRRRVGHMREARVHARPARRRGPSFT